MRFLAALLSAATFCLSSGFPASYYKLPVSKQKKEFASFMNDMITTSNENIKDEREFVKRFFSSAIFVTFGKKNSKELSKLAKIAEKYKIKLLFDKKEYLRKIDAIPHSLAIAQAAVESAWGKSRFAKEANNIYGHWTFGKRGLVPQNRDENKTHKIRIFDSLQHSTDAYALNLNRNRAYRIFREKRKVFRERDKFFSGVEAAKTMINYSQIKHKYIDLLTNIIQKNGFEKYDKKGDY